MVQNSNLWNDTKYYFRIFQYLGQAPYVYSPILKINRSILFTLINLVFVIAQFGNALLLLDSWEKIKSLKARPYLAILICSLNALNTISYIHTILTTKTHSKLVQKLIEINSENFPSQNPLFTKRNRLKAFCFSISLISFELILFWITYLGAGHRQSFLRLLIVLTITKAPRFLYIIFMIDLIHDQLKKISDQLNCFVLWSNIDWKIIFFLDKSENVHNRSESQGSSMDYKRIRKIYGELWHIVVLFHDQFGVTILTSVLYDWFMIFTGIDYVTQLYFGV